jgi:hypothetical protein
MMGRADLQKARSWIGASEQDLYAALPPEFIADWDSTVNTRYGHQEEVEIGYNPHKPGQGSHHPLLCVVAGTRLALHMEWRQGNTVSATGWQEAMDKVWSHPNVRGRLKLNRGDIGFAKEKIMAWHEEAGKARPHFLFKLRLSKNVKRVLAAHPMADVGRAANRGHGADRRGRRPTRWLEPSTARVFIRTMKPANPSAQDVFWGTDQDEVDAYVTSLPETASPG